MKKLILLSIISLFGLGLLAQEEARLLRFPAIHKNKVVFTYAGDLYLVDKEGGMARKLTNHNGYEMFARFSPDGKTIAFTGQYDGNTEVFSIPSTGGSPKRLTHTATLGRDDVSDRMGPNNIVMTWKNNNEIVYRSRKQSFNSFKGQLFMVNKEGGMSKELPFSVASWCSYSTNKNKLAYNSVFREFRTWKYYKGGMADDIRIYDFTTGESEMITNNEYQDIFPMWSGKKIYFLSDRDRIMNLFVYDTETKETKKITDYTEYDIKFPSLGPESIIYENGGFLYTYDLNTEEISKIDIYIANDFLYSRKQLKDASKNIASASLSPDGKRAVFGARGDIYTVPAKSGITKNLTSSSGVHDRNVEWSPNGKYISYISDATGEDEIYIIDKDGENEPVQLTKNSDTYKYNPVWSPDSKKLLWSDKKLRLNYIDIESKKVTTVVTAEDWEIRSYKWSPDNNWITYVLPIRNETSKVYVYNLKTKESVAVTDEWYNSGNPSFSSDGKYLFFSSSRDFNPIYSNTEWNHAYRDMNRVYFITLQKDTDSPLAPENDEVEIKSENDNQEANKEDNNGKTDEDNSNEITIDFDNIINRIVDLPVNAGNYWNIQCIGNSVYYNFHSSKSGKASLKMFSLDDKEEKDLGNYNSYMISADKKKMMISKGNKYAVINLPKSEIKVDKYLDLNEMKTWIDLKAEWEQIFNESWRQMRDFFYAPNMHGLNWEEVKEKYEPLVPYVNNRYDLSYIIGEMIGELNVGHAYISGGDRPKPERIDMGLLGAKIEKDPSGYFKITEILEGENWTKNIRSPLTEVGVNIKKGDYIIAINGKSTTLVNDIYQLLINTAGKEVEITINNEPSVDGAKEELIVPIKDESKLYYFNWVRNNIKKVNEATNGQVGYIHIPDMGPGGLNEFVKYFYPQLKKKGLIIDDRGNGGGNVSPMIIERLRRELAMYGMARNTGISTKPAQIHIGPKVALIDKYSASDGDLFAYQFKAYDLGTTIGTRTWGGVVGIRGSLPFIDGGSLRKPEFAPFDVEGNEFIIEGIGVTPDIIVENDPAKEYQGKDQQLNKAIEVILEQIEELEETPEIPDYPDKSK